MGQYKSQEKQELTELCGTVRALVQQNEYQQCETIIFDAMRKYPHAPEPHNLIGVLLEKEGNLIAAMKHFRAAWALDPTYMPARCNLDRLASFYAGGKCAFDQSDCSGRIEDGNCRINCDENGTTHIPGKG